MDVEALETREYLRGALALGLAALGYTDLDVAVVRGPDRRVTRLIARWVFSQVHEGGNPVFAGLRYLSRLKSDWECWALFDDVWMHHPRVESIPATHPALLSVAQDFGIHVH